MKAYCGIKHNLTKDISLDPNDFIESREFHTDEGVLDRKQETMESIPFASILDTLEQKVQSQINEVKEDCLNNLDIYNLK